MRAENEWGEEKTSGGEEKGKNREQRSTQPCGFKGWQLAENEVQCGSNH